MQFRALGRTGMQVSAVGFGGIPIMGGSPVGDVSEEEAVHIIRCALDRGVNFIDTARSYGQSEHRIGLAIKGREPRPFIATKTYIEHTTGDPERFTRDIDESLAALDLDCIDLYQIHYIDRGYEFAFGEDGAVARLKRAQAEGKIRHIGVTAHDPDIAIRALETGEFETIQVPYNIAKPQAAERLFPWCAEHGIGVIVMKPIAGGALATPHEIIPHLAERDLPTATNALRFVLAHPAVSVAIPGMDSTREVDENLSVLAQDPVRAPSEAELAGIRARLSALGEHFCHACTYCDRVCEANLPLSDIFRLERHLVLYGLEQARSQFAALGRTAEECLDCGKCEERCPYRLPVREQLRRATAALGGT